MSFETELKFVKKETEGTFGFDKIDKHSNPEIIASVIRAAAELEKGKQIREGLQRIAQKIEYFKGL